MTSLDSYEFWLDVIITGNAVETDNVTFYNTDDYGWTELGKYMTKEYPSYKFSHNLDDKSVYTSGNDVIMVMVTVGEELIG